jgi:5'-3' exonuclease
MRTDSETQDKPVFLIDASVFVFRSYYALKPEWFNQRNEEVHAVYGFARFLIRFLKQTSPRHIAIAFDESLASSFRNEIYPPYKANREPAPIELKRQFAYCQQVAELLGIATFKDHHYEADDLIGSLHKKHADAGHKVCVVSADKDLAQLIRPGDWWWDYGKSKPLNYDAITEKFGVKPEQIIDFLALAGDQADNIPGVKGVGPKTAQMLLHHFEDLDHLLNDYRQIEFLSIRGAKSCMQKIKQHQEQARISKLLAQIVLDVPLPNGAIIKQQNVDEGAMQAFIEDMNFGPLLRRELLTAAAL